MSNTVVHITTPGDKSTGIQPSHTTVNFDFDVLFGVNREKVRAEFQIFFSGGLSCECGVRFGDECPDRGKVMRFSKKRARLVCKNKNCISNAP